MIKKTILFLLLFSMVVLMCSGWRVIRCVGVSMNPTFSNNHFVIGMSPKIIPFKVGDTVIAVDPTIYWDGHIGIIHKRVKSINGNEIFLQGDNTKESYDSRHHGTINRTNILKTVIYPRR